MKPTRDRLRLQGLLDSIPTYSPEIPEIQRVCVMLTFLTVFVQEEEGATMVEYGLMVTLIALVCFGAVGALGQSVVPIFEGVNTTLAP
jgi:pilus assembly protein Flp/PilA